MADDLDIHMASVIKFNSLPWDIAAPILFPGSFSAPSCEPHKRLWLWGDQIQLGDPQDPFFAIWSRNLAKSTSAETLIGYLLLLMRRKYCWYVSETQSSADDHVASITASLTTEENKQLFPLLKSARMDRVGEQNVWRRNRFKSKPLGITIDSVGLNSRIRGRKDEDQRPDIIVFDDIDGRHDTAETTQKKLQIISDTILPSGSTDVIYMGIQNLVSVAGVFAQIVNGELPIKNAIIDGPIPAIQNLKLDGDQIVGGTAVWPERLSIEVCQRIIDDTPNGFSAFMREYQHDVEKTEGAAWTRETIHHLADGVSPPDSYDYVIVGVDPAGNKKDTSDLTGIVVAGVKDNIGYILEDRSGRYDANEWAKIVCDLADLYHAQILVETNQGGMYLKTVIKNYKPNARIIERAATISKEERATPVSQLYQQNRVFHVKPFPDLEKQMITWSRAVSPKSPDRIDALTWALWMLAGTKKPKRHSLAKYSDQPPAPSKSGDTEEKKPFRPRGLARYQ